MILRGANSMGAIHTPSLGHLRRAKNHTPSIFICDALYLYTEIEEVACMPHLLVPEYQL